jgi:hypothetical protein
VALFGKGACRQEDALAMAIDSYSALQGPTLGAKTIADLTRRLELLRFASKSEKLEEVILKVANH